VITAPDSLIDHCTSTQWKLQANQCCRINL